jgi:hypothetical protein
MNFDRGMRRLAIFMGVLGAVTGGIYAHKVLRNIPSERYQHKVFEKLAASDQVKQDQSMLRLAKEHGAIFDGPISSELLNPQNTVTSKVKDAQAPPVTLPPDFKDWDSTKLVTKSVSTNGIKAIFYKPDLTVDYFEMRDGGIVTSVPAPSAWIYLLWIAYPAIGFAIVWGTVCGIGWVIVGFCPAVNQ